MVTTKKTLQKQVKKLEYENDQFRFALKYLAFDLDATRREKNGAMAQVILLREELAELKQVLKDEGLIG